ncbi:MAG: c-type cytochrome [Myxococcales bacterium]|nr:c-type cytochrome [Myxococcales bacterium]
MALSTACGSSSEPTPPPTSAAAAPAIPDPAPPQPLGGLAALAPAHFDRAQATLGQRLFFENRLSGDGTLNCSSCHSLDHGGAEDRRVSTGIHGQQGPINAPPVLNAAGNFVQFWDGRAADLEAQAAGPVGNPLEMGASWDTVVTTIAADESYRTAFAALYPGDAAPVTQDHITHAIAEYERMLVTPGRFDRFVGGDASAMTDDERRGYALFTSLGCTSCHTGPNVGGTMYQRMGLVRDWFAQVGRPLTDADNGRFNVTHDEADRHRFKVPTLRNVALTGPYFHDGSAATLTDAVRTMGAFQLGRDLTDEQIRLLVAFLGTLTGDVPADARPAAAEDTTATPPAPSPATTEPPIPPGGPRS